MRALPARLAVHAEMRFQRLADLEADREAGIEAGDRLLEDHREVAADHLPAATAGQALQILAAEGHAVRRHRGGLRQEPHDGKHGHRFSRARLADDGNNLARIDVELDAVHRLEGPARGRKADGEVADLEEGHGGWRSVLGIDLYG